MRTNYVLMWFTSIAIVLALLPLGAAQAEHRVAAPFRAYYDQHQGIRVLGYALTDLIETNGYQSQYFEKGRLESHQAELVAAAMATM